MYSMYSKSIEQHRVYHLITLLAYKKLELSTNSWPHKAGRDANTTEA